MKLTVTEGLLGFDGTACHILHTKLETGGQVEPYLLQQALRQLNDELAENETALGDEANAVVLKLEGMEETPWAMAMATALVLADHEYPQTAVFMTAPGADGEVMCVARGDMEHYAPDYLNPMRTFPLTDTGKTPAAIA